MSGNHSTWPEWVYVGVVVALLCYVGAEAWNIERIVEHVPADAEIIKVTGPVSNTHLTLPTIYSV